MKTLNNTVIKNLNPEMGKRIIQKYQDDGWDTREMKGTTCELHDNIYIYYGVIDGFFDNYTFEQVTKAKARIIELDEWQPVRGERVLVWSIDESISEEKIYITTIEGSKYPIVTVSACDESQFENGKKFGVNVYQNMKRIEPVNTELQELEAKYRELGEKIEQLKNKK